MVHSEKSVRSSFQTRFEVSAGLGEALSESSSPSVAASTLARSVSRRLSFACLASSLRELLFRFGLSELLAHARVRALRLRQSPEMASAPGILHRLALLRCHTLPPRVHPALESGNATRQLPQALPSA